MRIFYGLILGLMMLTLTICNLNYDWFKHAPLSDFLLANNHDLGALAWNSFYFIPAKVLWMLDYKKATTADYCQRRRIAGYRRLGQSCANISGWYKLKLQILIRTSLSACHGNGWKLLADLVPLLVTFCVRVSVVGGVLSSRKQIRWPWVKSSILVCN